MRELVAEMSERLRLSDERIKRYDYELARYCAQDERCMRLRAAEGIGPLAATAPVAAVGNAHNFRSGHELSAGWGWCRVIAGAATGK